MSGVQTLTRAKSALKLIRGPLEQTWEFPKGIRASTVIADVVRGATWSEDELAEMLTAIEEAGANE